MEQVLPSREMVEHFRKRTQNHIDLVGKNLYKVSEVHPDLPANLIDKTRTHDDTKFKEPNYIPYVWITWMYKCKADNTPFKWPDGMEQEANEATIRHVLTEPHHPEYWACHAPININNRDQAVEAINAEKMPPLDIIEMVCDWLAVAQERGGTARDWYVKNVPSRWIFNDKQKELIEEILKIFE